jgi:16S rRNA (adenine(1408)-N(1))-methyltransferase
VTIVRVVGKQRTVPVSKAVFDEMHHRYAKTSVDVGTGDGRFAYHLASADPDRLVIGIDALAQPMGERAATAARKPVKGGRPNLMFVHAAVETLPVELEHAADEVYVLLPWGALLEGIVSARPTFSKGSPRCAAPAPGWS